MTAQAHDRVRWRNHDYTLVGVEGSGLFDPHDYGLEPRATTTANWRGWVATYSVEDDQLALVELDDVGLVLDGEKTAPSVNGVTPQQTGPGPYVYPNLDMPIPFTGRLLIARDFIQSLYVHMGFHPAWQFEESWELTLDDGILIEGRDLSAEMRKVRNAIMKGNLGNPDDPTRPGWIERTFRLDFLRSKPDSEFESFD